MPTVVLATDRDRSAVPDRRLSSERALVTTLAECGVVAEELPWHGGGVGTHEADLVLVRDVDLDPTRRESFLAWARAAAEHTALWNPVEVLRWNSHRSYLLELEERGAPLVPTAWTSRGDRVDLAALLDARGWERALIAPAVPGADQLGTIVGVGGCELAAGQGALDHLLSRDDVAVQRLPDDGAPLPRTAAILVDGEVSHLLRWHGQAGAEQVDDAEAATLAAWVVEATGVDLLLARVELQPDEVGTLQLVGLDAVAPDLGLDVVPDAAERITSAILRRLPPPA